MSIEQSIKPAILLIATGRYKQFVEPLVKQIDRYFLPSHEIAVIIFSDEVLTPRTTMRVDIVWTRIGKLGWPWATLYRYKIFNQFSEYLKKFSHLFYMDVDSAIEDEISDEILVDGLLAVKHPGCYAANRWGSPNNSQKSTSWFPEEYRKTYCCGGVNGGRVDHFLEMCKVLSERINEDEKNNVMAEWHDETHSNRYWSFDKPELVTMLDPSYCMPEKKETQIAWGLGEFVPKILALDKNHKEMRS